MGKCKTQNRTRPLKSGRVYFMPPLAGHYEQKIFAREHWSLRGLIGLIGPMCLLNRPQYNIGLLSEELCWHADIFVCASPRMSRSSQPVGNSRRRIGHRFAPQPVLVSVHRHILPTGHRINPTPVLAGLHHEHKEGLRDSGLLYANDNGLTSAIIR